MAGYSTYTSPIDRMGAIAQVGQGIQNQRLQREEAPLRQGLMATQAHAQTLNNLSQEQQIQMVDKKLKETDFAANAYEALLAPDDTTMLGIIQQRMPDFLAAAQQEQATPDAMRERLNGLVQRGAALGVIQLPQQAQPKDDRPSDLKIYDAYATQETQAGRQPLSINEWMLQGKKAGATKVTFNAGEDAPAIGTIPPGWQAIRNLETGEYSMKPIKGGPVAQEIAQKEATKGMRETAAQRYGKIVLDDIDRALDTVENDPFFTTGFTGGQVLANLGGTKAKNLQQKLLTIKANIGFDRLQEMRQSSPTGGALGPVSDTENALLQATLGSVEQSQSADELKYNLKRLKDLYQDIVHGPGNRPSSKKQNLPSIDEISVDDLENMSPDELRALRDANQ